MENEKRKGDGGIFMGDFPNDTAVSWGKCLRPLFLRNTGTICLYPLVTGRARNLFWV